MKTTTIAAAAGAAIAAVKIAKRAPLRSEARSAAGETVAREELAPIDYTLPSALPHVLLKDGFYWYDDDYGPAYRVACKDITRDPKTAVLISSRITPETQYQAASRKDMHAPILDIDMGAELVPEVGDTGSSILHLDVAMDWRTYQRLVKALVKAGVARPSASIVAHFEPDGPSLPGLPIDVPAALVPSSKKGHFHLYLDAPMHWYAYRRLLRALAKAGVIEQSWVEASIKSTQTLLTPPWKMKAASR